MRRSEWEDRCKRHPEHRMSKGVCPYCLRDRLAHLSAATNTTRRASSSSATSSPYSADSPTPRHVDLSADASIVHGAVGGSSSSFVKVAFSQPLMRTAVKEGREDEVKGKKSGKKKKKKIARFLSRLVGAEKRRHAEDGGGELFYSKTMKEKTSSKWVFF